MEIGNGFRTQKQMESEYGYSVRRNACPPRTLSEKTFFVIIILLSAIVIGLAIALANIARENRYNRMKIKATEDNCTHAETRGSNESLKKICENNDTQTKASENNASEICYTPSCITAASNLVKSMDLSVDPCEDFYSFVCGNWIKNAYLSSSKESHFTEMESRIRSRVKEILDDLEKEEDLPDHKRKVSDFYRRCMDTDHRDIVGAQELLSDLEKFGGWPLIKEDWDPSTFSWSNLMVDLFKSGYNNNMLFSVGVNIDARNSSRSLISIGNPTLGMGNKEFYGSPRENWMTFYKDVVFTFAKRLEKDLDKEKSREVINDAFEIERQLANVIENIEWNSLESYYHITTLQKLETSSAMIPWRKILQDLLPHSTELSDEERIMVTSPSMLKALNDILEELHASDDGKRALANYMFYRTVFDASEHLDRNFYFLNNYFWDTYYGYGTWYECAETTMGFFPSSLAASYVTKYMDDTSKHFVEEMLEEHKSALLDVIQKSGWLDDETKQYALLKVRKMRSTIAYLDEIMDDETLNEFYKDINITDDHFSNVKQLTAFKLKKNMEGLHDVEEILRWAIVNYLLDANAYNKLQLNAITIPLGLLQDPILVPSRPNYINYGSLGFILGHELNHAFDNDGYLHGVDGSYRMWWSNNTKIKFQERTKCLEDQYNEYYVPAADTFVNGTRTLSENIADNGGLQTAYNAYMKVLERAGPEKLLPGLPYNARQMFWISFTSVWCARQTDDSIKASTQSSEYPISQFRVMGALSNLEEFSRDFNCKSDSAMNPRSKCSLWK